MSVRVKDRDMSVRVRIHCISRNFFWPGKRLKLAVFEAGWTEG